MDDVIELVSRTYAKNEYGVPEATETKREVYASVASITRVEFFEAGRNGLNPSLVFRVFAGDYSGETIVEHDGKRYGIYRTYRTDDDYMELYAERKGGTNGQVQD